METDGNREITSVVVLSEKGLFSVGSNFIDFLLVGLEDSCNGFLGQGLGFFGSEG